MSVVHPNEELIRRLYDARSRGDRGEVARLLAHDVRWHEPRGLYGKFSGDLNGIDAVFAKLFDRMERNYDASGMVVHDVLANDDHAVALVDWWAERGGKRVDGREAAIHHITAGRIDEVWFLTDADYGEFFA